MLCNGTAQFPIETFPNLIIIIIILYIFAHTCTRTEVPQIQKNLIAIFENIAVTRVRCIYTEQ